MKKLLAPLSLFVIGLAALVFVLAPVRSGSASALVSTPSATPTDTPPPENAAGTATVTAPSLDPNQDVGFVRFAHTATDVGPLDIYQVGDQTPLVANLQYGQFTDYVTLNVPQPGFIARPAGSGAAGTELFRLNWDIHSDTSWIILAAGLNSRAAFIMEPISVVRDHFADAARVRVVNMVWGGAALSLVGDHGFKPSHGLGYVGYADQDIPPGTYSLQVVTGDSNVVASLDSVELAANTISTLLIAGGSDGNPPIQLLNLVSSAYVTRVRMINQRPDAVDVYYRPGDTLFVSNLASGGDTGFIEVPSQSVTFVAYAPGTGAGSHEMASISVELRPARELTLTLTADGNIQQTEAEATPAQ